MTARPFTVHVTQETLDDLRRRLSNTRWPDEIEGAGWDRGTNLRYLKTLVEYWRDVFDWRRQEERINRFAHFRADIDGLGIHFIHERGHGERPLPIVFTHGFPDSFLRFAKIIPLLTDPAAHGGDPADAFDVVVPSLPGYGFSDKPKKQGTLFKIADLWAALMTRELGYERFGAHGGDWGSTVTEFNVQRWTEMPRGGHLAAMEEPELLAADIRAFFRPLRGAVSG